MKETIFPTATWGHTHGLRGDSTKRVSMVQLLQEAIRSCPCSKGLNIIKLRVLRIFLPSLWKSESSSVSTAVHLHVVSLLQVCVSPPLASCVLV